MARPAWPPVYRPDAGLRYNAPISSPVVTFDAGQTLIELDLDFLALRLEARGITVEPAALGRAMPGAWAHYDTLVAGGAAHPWQAFMTVLLEQAGVRAVAPHVAWLWREQPRVNLFRKPIPEMIALARELRSRGVIVGVLSNSEGRLAELFAEIAIADVFGAIIDSGRVGVEKPDRRIFELALAALGAPGADAIHIGDSWAADIVGARGAGWRAIWFGPKATAVADPGVARARDAAGVRAALVSWGVL